MSYVTVDDITGLSHIIMREFNMRSKAHWSQLRLTHIKKIKNKNKKERLANATNPSFVEIETLCNVSFYIENDLEIGQLHTKQNVPFCVNTMQA